MTETSPELDFLRWRTGGGAEALGRVFDALAPQLLLVAAHLAGGSHAEDLVQATFVDAIRHKDRWDRTRPLAPWLVGILGNHVRQELRRRQRQPVPDAQRLHGKDRIGPADAAEANELAEAVRVAMAALPLQYHQVLSLRFVHGLELGQIAHSLRLPLGTVKTRLYRGMAMVKRALPASLASAFAVALLPGRGLAAVKAAVLGHAAATTTATVASGGIAVAAWWIGVLAMKKTLLAVAAVMLATGAWVAFGGAPAAESSDNGRGGAVAPMAVVKEVVPVRERDTASGSTRPDAVNERQAVAMTGSLAVNAVWGVDGVPAIGVPLVIRTVQRSRGETGVGLFDRSTDVTGCVRIDDIAPGMWIVGTRYQSEGYDVTAGAVTDVAVKIDDHVQLNVLVVDRDGQPLADANVWAIDALGEQVPQLLGRSNRDGRCTSRSLPVAAVFARKPGLVPCATVSTRDKRGAVDLRLVLDTTACRLTGTVVDPRQQPVPDALVVIGIDDSYRPADDETRHAVTCRTDARGAFSCDEALPGEHTVMGVDPRFALSMQRVTLAADDTTTCTVVLRVGATVQGRVTDRSDQPLANAKVSTSEGMIGLLGFGREHEVWTDADGRYRLSPLEEGKPEIRIEAPGQPMAARWVALTDGVVVTLDLKIPDGGDITGRLVDDEGKPLAGWLMYAEGIEQIGTGIRSFERGDLITDRDGKFTFEGLPDLPFRIATYGPTQDGLAGVVTRSVVADVRPPCKDLVLRVANARAADGTLVVRVVWPEGTPREPVTVIASPITDAPVDGPAPSLQLTANDTGKIGPLPAGDYRVFAKMRGRVDIFVPNVHLAAGETLTLPPFRFDAQRILRVRLRHADGHAATAAKVMVVGSSGPGLGWHMLDEDKARAGDYVTPPLLPKDCQLFLRGDDFAACVLPITIGADAETLVEQAVQAGTPVTFHFVPHGPPPERWIAALQVHLKDAQGIELITDSVLADGHDGCRWTPRLLPGSYTLDVLARPGGAANVPFTVQSASAQPQLVEVPLRPR